MSLEIVCIVEGHGEVRALPVLIRRIRPDARITRVLRIPKSRLLKKSELEGEVETAAALAETPEAVILILIDADEDCPAELGPALAARAAVARSDRRVIVSIAIAEFENLFLAAAKSLRGRRGLPEDLTPPPKPESVRGTKEWLRRARGSYSETIDQPALAAVFDLDEARSGSRSFARLEQKLLAI